MWRVRARIVALADVFDALTHPRPYKHAWSLDATVSEIRSLQARQFDPSVVSAFMELDPASLVELPSTRRCSKRPARRAAAQTRPACRVVGAAAQQHRVAPPRAPAIVRAWRT